LTIASLTHASDTVDFVGSGLGVDARNRIFITGQANGLIGPWATVNGSALAAYDSALGVYAAGDASYTDISARDPSTIPASSLANIRINSDETSGPIALAAANTTSWPTTNITFIYKGYIWNCASKSMSDGSSAPPNAP
jgi:hypothetical protein